MAKALSWWIEKSSFLDTVGLTFGAMIGRLPEDLIAEREPFFGRDLKPERLAKNRSIFLQRLSAQMQWFEQMLADGRQYAFGEQVSAVDLSAYHLLWFARQNAGPDVARILPRACSMA